MTVETPKPIHKNTGFAGDVIKLVSGTMIAQVLTILVSPLLTRLYDPSAFGVSALFVSILSIFGVAVCLRYEFAIMLPQSDEEAANLLGLSLGISVFISLLTVPVIWLGGPLILRLLNAPELSPYLWLVPVTLLFGGFGSGHPALNYWASRNRQFTQLSITRVAGSISTLITQLGAGYTGFATAGSLIVANVLGSVISPVVLGWQIWRQKSDLFRRSIHWPGMIQGLKRYRKFPLYGIWSLLLITVSGQLPFILLATFFSSAVVGYYSLGNRLLYVPMSMVGTAIGQVFYQRASEARANNSLANMVENTFTQLTVLGLFPFLLISFMGRDIFIIVFGENWAEAGIYVQILGVFSFFQFIYAPMSSLFSALEKQEFGLFINLVFFIVRLVSLFIGGLLKDARLAILVFAAFGTLTYIFSILMVVSASGASWRKMVAVLLANLLRFVPACAVLLVLIFFSAGAWIKIGVSCVLLIAYYGYVIKTNPEIYRSFAPIINRVRPS